VGLGEATPVYKERCPIMDRNETDEIKQHLMQTSDEFRELAMRHQELDIKVAKIDSDPHATEQDEVEEHRLKKLKLHLKDQMQEILSRYKTQHA
jgi:uncharacterized protein YdcH (DUF465 family)